jgi:tetratricopeptide (TPR) repeat protein
MKTRLRIFLNLLLFLFGSIASLEGYCQLFDRQPIFENHTTAKFGISTAFRRNQEVNLTFGDFPFTLKTDNKNLRNFAKTTYKKSENVFRILCIGGSIFAASGVNNDETFASQLDQFLQEKSPNQKYEVINAAKNSWELPEYNSFFRNEGYKYIPDLVVVYFHTGELSTLETSKYEADELKFTRSSENSVLIEIKGLGFKSDLNNLAAQSLKIIQNIPFYDFLFYKSHALRLIESKTRKNLTIKKIKKSTKTNLEDVINTWDLKPGDSINWKTDYGEIANTSENQIEAVLYSIGLETFYTELQKNNSKLLFLLIPSFQEVLNIEDLSNRPKPFSISKQSGFEWLDLAKPLTQFQLTSFTPLNYPSFIHWTPAGHKLASLFTFNFLIEKNLVSKAKSLKKIKLTQKIQTSLADSNNRIIPILDKQNYDLLLKGINLKNQYRMDKAEENLLQYLQKHPNNLMAKSILGFTYYQDKNFQKSIETFESVLNTFSKEAPSKNLKFKSQQNEIQYYLSLSKLLDPFWKEFKANNFEKSLGYLEKAEKLNGKYDLDKVYDNFAMVHYKLKNLKKTEAYWRKAIDLNPDFFGYYQNLGNLFFDQKRFHDATTFYKQALNHGKPNAKVSTFLGLSYIFLNEMNLAKKELKTALKLQPQSKIARNALNQINKL